MKSSEKCLVWLLGLLLLAAGGRDVVSYSRAPGQGADFDLLQENSPQRQEEGEYYLRARFSARLEGISGVEPGEKGPFRHGLGPVTRLVLRAEHDPAARLHLQFFNAVEGQTITVRYDGQTLESFPNLGREAIERTYPLSLGPGEHVFSVEYERWNHHGVELAPGDGRPMAGTFDRLELNFLSGPP